MRLIYFLILILCVLSNHKTNGQKTTSDSAEYWVNQNYLNCINSGKSICSCQEQNIYLILHLDTKNNKLKIDPAIQFSWENLTFDIKATKIKYTYSINENYGMDSGGVLIVYDKKLNLIHQNDTMTFSKIKVKKLDDWTEGDLWRQLGVINCKPLLKYKISSCSDSNKTIISQEELLNYIKKGLITISCSDDYYYNVMHVKKSDTEFYMVYSEDRITIYKMPLRGRGEKVDVNALKECQIYNKNE